MKRAVRVLDAGLGTRLVDRGLDLTRDDPTLWVVDHPEVVGAFHAADVDAGADAVLTCTFGAGSRWLGRYGHPEATAAICRQGVALARGAGPEVEVWGALGPAATPWVEAAEVFASEGVTGVVLETFEMDEAERAVGAVASRVAVPIVVSLFDWRGPIQDWARRLIAAGASNVGMNCSVAWGELPIWIQRIHDAVGRPVWVKPAAGLPPGPLLSPEAFARAVPAWVDAGAGWIGGCCGTTHEHVAAIRAALDRRT